MLTEFWGIEVKPGQTVKCQTGDRSIVHLSQASLGVTKKEKGAENVPIFVKIDDKKLVIGTLSIDKCAQIHYDLIFDKEFELSHGSKNASVFFIGYKRVNLSYNDSTSEDGFDDSSSADGYEIVENAHGEPSENKQGKSTAEKASAGKDGNMAAKLMANTEKPKKELVDDCDEDEDDDDSEEDSDENEDIVDSSGDSSEEERDDSSEEESTPEMVLSDKKRKSDSASKSPIREKKARVVTPVENNKIGGDGKKAHVHVATPYPAKQGGKPQQSSKSSGSVTFKSRNRTFNSENAFQAHRKAKHIGAAK